MPVNTVFSWFIRKRLHQIALFKKYPKEYMANLLHEVFHCMYPKTMSTKPLVSLYCDNQGAIHMALNEVNNNRTKHIDIRHHYLRQKLLDNFAISKVHTNENVADIFTKPLDHSKFSKFVTLLGIHA